MSVRDVARNGESRSLQSIVCAHSRKAPAAASHLLAYQSLFGQPQIGELNYHEL